MTREPSKGIHESSKVILLFRPRLICSLYNYRLKQLFDHQQSFGASDPFEDFLNHPAVL
jgi:hypothetical protein